MSFIYNKFKTKLAKGLFDFLETGDDLRVLLVDNTTTCDTEDDTEFLAGFTTLGELSGTGYVRKQLANQAVNEDLPNDRAEFDADDVTWTAINAGTAAAAVIYRHVTDDSNSEPILFIDTGGFPLTTNGGDLTIQWNIEGISQFS